jgi:hypothetical protein
MSIFAPSFSIMNLLWKAVGLYQRGFKPKESRVITQIEIGREAVNKKHMVFIDIQAALDSVIKALFRDTVARRINRLERDSHL